MGWWEGFTDNLELLFFSFLFSFGQLILALALHRELSGGFRKRCNGCIFLKVSRNTSSICSFHNILESQFYIKQVPPYDEAKTKNPPCSTPKHHQRNQKQIPRKHRTMPTQLSLSSNHKPIHRGGGFQTHNPTVFPRFYKRKLCSLQTLKKTPDFSFQKKNIYIYICRIMNVWKEDFLV